MTGRGIVSAVRKRYGLDVTEVVVLDGWLNDACRVETPGRSYVLKRIERFDGTCPNYAFVDGLRSRGIPAPRFRRNRDGRIVTQLRDGDSVVVTTYREGLGFRATRPQLESAGRTLGGLHDATGPLVDDADVPEGIQTDSTVEFLSNCSATDLADTDLSPDAVATFVALGEWAAVHLHGASASARRPVLQHGDYHGDNLLFDDESRVTLVFDWENSAPGVALRDLAKGVVTCSIRPGSVAVDPEQATRFLEGYVDAHPIAVSPTVLVASLVDETLSSVAWGLRRLAAGESRYAEVAEHFAVKAVSLDERRGDLEAAFRRVCDC